jgi:hypothetical protein
MKEKITSIESASTVCYEAMEAPRARACRPSDKRSAWLGLVISATRSRMSCEFSVTAGKNTAAGDRKACQGPTAEYR